MAEPLKGFVLGGNRGGWRRVFPVPHFVTAAVRDGAPEFHTGLCCQRLRRSCLHRVLSDPASTLGPDGAPDAGRQSRADPVVDY
jgi:hypothetical protein